jgi:hypothetical protein
MPEFATPEGSEPRPPRSRRPSHRAPLRARPRPRAPRGRARTAVERILGVVATAALLGVGIAVAVLVTDKRDESAADAAAPAAAKPAPTPAPATKPKRPPLTQAQLASRRSAVAQMRKQGFVPVSLAAYRPRQDLRVLIGRPTAASGMTGRRAFFFERGEYLGTDAETASARLKVTSQNKSGITLAYTLFRPEDRACCPKGGTALVRFTMQDGRLQPSTPIPAGAVRLRTGA